MWICYIKISRSIGPSEGDGIEPAGQTHGPFISISCSGLLSGFEEGKNKQNHALGAV